MEFAGKTITVGNRIGWQDFFKQAKMFTQRHAKQRKNINLWNIQFIIDGANDKHERNRKVKVIF